ncbi:hypothetical protein [Nocardioides sp.]|nr:hypothetical protein [Nocardioides sp.]
MTNGSQDPDRTADADQDAEPPTPDGQEPDTEQLKPGSEPASDPDPEPGS